MFIKLKDNSPVPSCAIWLGNSLLKPAEEGGAQIYKYEYDETFTRKDNTFKFYLDDAYYKYKRVKLYVKNFKGESITLRWEYGETIGTDQALIVGKWDTTIENPDRYDDSQAQGIYWRERSSEAVIPSPEDSGEHTIELWYYTGYYGRNMTLKVFPASLFSDITARFVADGYAQKYENEHYVRYINLAEEIQQTDGTWKKDGYYKDGELEYEYNGKVYAYWTDPNLQAKANGKATKAPVEAPVSSLTFDSGITKLDYIDENIPLKSTRKMFDGCETLTEVPYFSVSGVTDAYSMFYGCWNITALPEFDFADGVDMRFAFYNVSKLENIKAKNVFHAKSVENIFGNCRDLKKIENFDFSQNSSVNMIFDQCQSLYDLPEMDFSNASSSLYAFRGTYNLSDLICKGIFNCDFEFKKNISSNDDCSLTQRSIKSIIDTLQASTKTGLTITCERTYLIDDADGTYAAKIADIKSKGNKIEGISVLKDENICGWKFTNRSGKLPWTDYIVSHAYIDSEDTNPASPYRSLQKDGTNGLYLWGWRNEAELIIETNRNNFDFTSFDGFIHKTKIRKFSIRNCDDLKKVDLTNADFSGTTINDYLLYDLKYDTEVYNIDLTGAIIEGTHEIFMGSETKTMMFKGSIDCGFSFNVGYGLSKESIKSMLQACANTQNTNAKTLHNSTSLKYGDTDGSLTELISQAIAKGWTIEGIEIIGQENMVCVNYTTTDGQVPQKFKDIADNTRYDASTYGKFYLPKSNDPANYNQDWNGMNTLKTIDGADKELKCSVITVANCSNLTKLDFKNIKFTNVPEGWGIWTNLGNLKEVLNLDFSDYAMENIYQLFSSTPNVPDVRLTGSLSNSIDFRDAGPAFTYETIMSILTACAASTNTNAKTCKFNSANVTTSEELTAKIKECTDKGWTFEGLTIN